MRNIPRHVEALLSALRFQNPDTQALQALSDYDWRRLLSFTDLMRLTLPLGRACGGVLPAWVGARLRRNFEDNSEHFEGVKSAYKEIADALQAANAEFLVIKGFAQCPEFSEDARLRPQSDIDLFCPPDSIFRARDALLDLGYEPDTRLDHLPSDHLPPMARKTDWQWRGNFFDPDLPLGVELHFRLWDDDTRLSPPGLDEFWQRRLGKHVAGIVFPALDPLDNLGYFSLHLLRNLLRGEWILHHVYEVARFLHLSAEKEEFWQSWRDLHAPRLRSLQAIGFCLAQRWFSCNVSHEVSAELEALPKPVEYWLDAFGESPLQGIFRSNKDTMWLHVALVDSQSDKCYVAMNSLLPLRVPKVDAPGQGTASDGKPKRFWPSERHAKYAFYLASRIWHHTRTLPRALWSGVRWWSGANELGEEFWRFFAASFCLDLGAFIFFLLFNLYLVDCGFSEKIIGRVTSAMAIGSLAGTIPAGILAQRFGLRRSLLLCFSLVPALSALRVLVSSQAAQLTLGFCAGGAMSIWAVCLSPALAQLTNERNRPFAFSLVLSTGIGVGVLGGALGGVLPGWLSKVLPAVPAIHISQLALLTSSVVIGLGVWPISSLKSLLPSTRERKVYPRNRFLTRYLPAIAVWSLVTGSFAPLANVYFSQYLRITLPRIGMIFSLAQLSQVVAILLAPIIYKKFGLVTGIMYTQLATAVALGGLAVAPIASAAAIIYTGYMAVQWMSEPGMYSLLMSEVTAEERSGASALNFFVISLGSALAAALAGEGFARFGYPVVIATIAGVSVIAGFMFRLLLGETARTATAASPATISATNPGSA